MSDASDFPMTLAPQCCDASGYIELGMGCAKDLSSCWHSMRPVGSLLYFSLPFRLGLGENWTIAPNALVMAASIAFGVYALRSLLPGATRRSQAWLAGALLLAHAWFGGIFIWNTLSDLPAGGSALMAIWALVLAVSTGRRRFYALSGFALGVSVMIRAFYLYPALACVSVAVPILAWRRSTRLDGAAFAGAFAVPVLVQVSTTHHFTGVWAFIAPVATAYGEDLHFRTVTYGYDTLIPARGFRYDALQCFRTSQGMLDALTKHAWSELSCLFAYRQWFYFGTYTPWGRVYLWDASERRESVLFFLSNVAVVAVAAAGILVRVRQTPLLVALFVFLGAIWGEATAIIPEARFLIVFYVAAWSFAVVAVMRHIQQRAVVEHPAGGEAFGAAPRSADGPGAAAEALHWLED